MKTIGMDHQITELEKNYSQAGYAIFFDTGMGKTWEALAQAERLFQEGRITGLLVIAPGGVYRNWSDIEIPAHLGCHYQLQKWDSKLSKKSRLALSQWAFSRDPSTGLDILVINVEAFQREDSYAIDVARAFLKSHRCLTVVDESSTIKVRGSTKTKEVLKLRKLSPFRRVLSGLPNPESPGDFYTQLMFVGHPSFTYQSYYAFRDDFVVTHPRTTRWPELMRFIPPDFQAELKDILQGRSYTEGSLEAFEREHPALKPYIRRFSFMAEVGAQNEVKLTALLKQMATVMDKSGLNLPEKLYPAPRRVTMTKDQAAAYKEMKKEARLKIPDWEKLVTGDVDVTVMNALGMAEKLHQIALGFIKADDGTIHWLSDALIDAVFDDLEGIAGKVVIWSHRTAILDRLMERMKKDGMAHHCDFFDGRTSQDDRARLTQEFQDPANPLRILLANTSVGKYSWTWTAAHTAIYASNGFKAEDRSQSEDRLHRKGQFNPVDYRDFVVEGTVTEPLLHAVRNKLDVARTVLGWPQLFR